jgi:AraC-like DNA-binding protein
LASIRRIESWPAGEWAAWAPVYRRLREFAERRSDELELRLQAMLLHAFAELCARHPESGDDGQRERFAPALRFMDAEFLRNPSLHEMAASVDLSPSHFHRGFVAAFGVTPHAYLLRRRMDLAQQLLARSRQPIREVAAACGYADQFYFSRVFKRWSKLSPERYRAERGASP